MGFPRWPGAREARFYQEGVRAERDRIKKLLKPAHGDIGPGTFGVCSAHAKGVECCIDHFLLHVDDVPVDKV